MRLEPAQSRRAADTAGAGRAGRDRRHRNSVPRSRARCDRRRGRDAALPQRWSGRKRVHGGCLVGRRCIDIARHARHCQHDCCRGRANRQSAISAAQAAQYARKFRQPTGAWKCRLRQTSRRSGSTISHRTAKRSSTCRPPAGVRAVETGARSIRTGESGRRGRRRSRCCSSAPEGPLAAAGDLSAHASGARHDGDFPGAGRAGVRRQRLPRDVRLRRCDRQLCRSGRRGAPAHQIVDALVFLGRKAEPPVQPHRRIEFLDMDRDVLAGGWRPRPSGRAAGRRQIPCRDARGRKAMSMMRCWVGQRSI